MLSEEEKREMLEDARDPARRQAFRKGRALLRKLNTRSLDDYIRFLNDAQKVFPFKRSKRKTQTKYNKL